METIYVIMLKDSETGFLEKELGSITLSADDEAYIVNLFATETENGQYLNIRLSTGKDVLDWEYDAVYDYYDPEGLIQMGCTVQEMADDYNPVWLVTMPFSFDMEATQQRVENVLKQHSTELADVFETIKDKKEEYTNEE